MRSELGVAAFARMVMTVLALVLPVVAEGREDFPVAAEAPLASLDHRNGPTAFELLINT